MKICSVGAKLFQADGRTDMIMLIVPFCNFENAPIKCLKNVLLQQ